jgi:hypothetical protein
MCVIVIFLIIALLVWCRVVHVSREGFDADDITTINEMKYEIHNLGTTNTLIKQDVDRINENLGYINQQVQQVGKINEIDSEVKFLGDALYPYLNSSGEFVLPNGSTGPKGDTGTMGGTGGTGPKGDKGTRGQDGANGASIFDVSRIMLNGDTDIFSKKVNDAEPQPSSAYTTLF